MPNPRPPCQNCWARICSLARSPWWFIGRLEFEKWCQNLGFLCASAKQKYGDRVMEEKKRVALLPCQSKEEHLVYCLKDCVPVSDELCCSVTQSCPTLCDPMDCSTPALPVPHHLPKFTQVHIHCIGNAIQTSHPLMPSSPFAFNLSQHQGLFQWISRLHQMTKILELQLQHQSFQWIFRVDFL